jgi:hypothetical protein
LVGCPKLGTDNVLFRYKTTFLCQGLAHMCGDDPRNVVCQDTCNAHTKEMETAFKNMCPDSTKAKEFLNNFKNTCAGPVEGSEKRHGVGHCISGLTNEKSTCGKNGEHAFTSLSLILTSRVIRFCHCCPRMLFLLKARKRRLLQRLQV